VRWLSSVTVKRRGWRRDRAGPGRRRGTPTGGRGPAPAWTRATSPH